MGAYAVTYTKSDSRYYVHLDGEKVGWVIKTSLGWLFYACTDKWATGTKLAESRTRRDATMDGLSALRIHHYGRIVRLSEDCMDEENVWFDHDRLDATWQALLDEKFKI